MSPELGPGTAILAPLGAAACYGVASVVQGVGARRAAAPQALAGGPAPRFGVGVLVDLVRQPLFLGGLGLDAIGFILAFVGLQHLPVFVVEAAVSSTVAITAVLGSRFLGDRLSGRDWALVGAVVLGLTLVGGSAGTGDRPTLDGFGTAVLILGVPFLVLAALAADPGGFRRRCRGDTPHPPGRRHSAAALGAVSGVGFGAFALAGRLIPAHQSAAGLLADPLFWAALSYAVLGLGIYGAALQRGSVTAVTAITIATEALFPSAVGLLLFSDGTRPGLAIVAVAGFILTVGGALRLALAKAAPALPAVTSDRFWGKS